MINHKFVFDIHFQVNAQVNDVNQGGTIDVDTGNTSKAVFLFKYEEKKIAKVVFSWLLAVTFWCIDLCLMNLIDSIFFCKRIGLSCYQATKSFFKSLWEVVLRKEEIALYIICS